MLSRWLLVVTLLSTALVVLMPPGLCPCWLNAEVERFHLHIGKVTEEDHSHEYLNQLSETTVADTHSIKILPARLLVALLIGMGALTRQLFAPAISFSGWYLLPPKPPPRS